jgi:hypothetical protein
MFCRSLFVLLSFFFWPLCCQSFFDLRNLIVPLWYLQTLLKCNYAYQESFHTSSCLANRNHTCSSMIGIHRVPFDTVVVRGTIRFRKSKKDWQHNGQKKKDKRTNNDLQNITNITKDRVTRARTPLKTGGKLRCSVWVSGSCSTSGTCRVTLSTLKD